MFTIAKRRLLSIIPILLLVGMTGFGIANALQGDGATEDRGPQPGDFLDAEGQPDISGYLVAGALYRNAPNLVAGSDIEFRAFGCVEGEPITIAFVPRLLAADLAEANALLEDDDPAKLAQEPVLVVELDEALAEGSTYELSMPEDLPLGFARIRVTCTDAEGAELVSDTIIDIVDEEEFAAEQAELEDGEEPAELSTSVDATG